MTAHGALRLTGVADLNVSADSERAGRDSVLCKRVTVSGNRIVPADLAMRLYRVWGHLCAAAALPGRWLGR